jgi:hypothetical protein
MLEVNNAIIKFVEQEQAENIKEHILQLCNHEIFNEIKLIMKEILFNVQ